MRILTLHELLDSIEKNGFPQSHHALVELYDNDRPASPDNVRAACALGQGMVNLNLHHAEVVSPSGATEVYKDSTDYNNVLETVRFLEDIMYKNDIEKKNINVIVDELRDQYSHEYLISHKIRGYTIEDSYNPLSPSLARPVRN